MNRFNTIIFVGIEPPYGPTSSPFSNSAIWKCDVAKSVTLRKENDRYWKCPILEKVIAKVCSDVESRESWGEEWCL